MAAIECWQTQCKLCHAKLEKLTLQTPWKCWRFDWSTEDVSRIPPIIWDGISQKPGEATGEHL